MMRPVHLIVWLCLMFFTTLWCNTAPANATWTKEVQAAQQSGTKPVIADAEKLLTTTEKLRKEAGKLKIDARNSTGEERILAFDQIVRKEDEIRKNLDQLIETVDNLKEQKLNTATLERRIVELVKDESAVIQKEIELIQSHLSDALAERDKATPEELIAVEQRIFKLNTILNDHTQALLDNCKRKDKLVLDSTSDYTYLDTLLQERAQTAAARVQLVLKQIDDVKQKMAKAGKGEQEKFELELTALNEKKTGTADNLSSLIDLMNERELDATEYSQILITATGEITSDIFDRKVAAGLIQKWFESSKEWLVQKGPGLIWKVLVFLLIIAAFKVLGSVVGRLVRKGLASSKLSISQLLREFFITFSEKAVIVLGILVALSQLGVQIGPLLAGLGVIGFIIGFALQETLSNFASGMMILLYRPFDVGDLIEAAGVFGRVSQLSLVSTTILTVDNQNLVVPNNKIWGDVIRNVTAHETRRVDMVFGMSYEDDIAHAERVLTEIVENHKLVLDDPAPVVKLHTLGESSVDFVVRPWVKTDDYWDVYWDITRLVKERFDAEKISIPYPQRDVHMRQ
jgi:small conductance mechanosensitive channel